MAISAVPFRKPSTVRLFAAGILLLFACLISTAPTAQAHPEDEFCTMDSGVDPALCRAMQELNRADRPPGETVDIPPELMAAAANSLNRSWLETALVYVRVGVFHILPSSLKTFFDAGWDHILFVLALFLTSRTLRDLLLQISAFTVAHTATLGLAASGLISPSGAIVEPLIAATIAFVAFEAIIFKEMKWWRPLIVFAFGLIHGMGFAGFFGDLGLPDGMFWTALISFNIGVEFGQLAVVLVAAILALAIRRALTVTGQTAERGAATYRRFVTIPACLLIGLTGLWWLVERVFLG